MKRNSNSQKDQNNDYERVTYSVSAVLQLGPYIYTEYLRLTPEEIKDRFKSWIRNNNKILRASISLDDDKFIPINDIEDLDNLIT